MIIGPPPKFHGTRDILINDAWGLSRATVKKSSNVVPASRWSLIVDSSKPVSHPIT